VIQTRDLSNQADKTHTLDRAAIGTVMRMELIFKYYLDEPRGSND
jgi:hypothetical protein